MFLRTASRVVLTVGMGSAIWASGMTLALAGGGGGCGEQSEGSGDAVAIEEFCFTPSILHVEANSTVTFVNRDEGITHNVYGTGWGIGDLKDGRAGTAAFEEEGLYPFQCSYHATMTGVVVVGGGMGPGNGATVDTQIADLSPPAEIREIEVPVAVDTEGQVTDWLPAGGVGLVIGAGLGLVLAGIALGLARRSGA